MIRMLTMVMITCANPKHRRWNFAGWIASAPGTGSGGAERGLPESEFVLDNGPEFRWSPLAAWSEDGGVRLEFIQPGKPVQKP